MAPDDFKNDWYGWLTNQCGHIVLGLGVSATAWALGLHWLFAPVVAALIYWFLIEGVAQRWALLADSIADTLFVMIGCSIIPAVLDGKNTTVAVMAVAASCLAYGSWRRRNV